MKLRRSLTDPPPSAFLVVTLRVLAIACAVLLAGWLVLGVNPFRAVAP